MEIIKILDYLKLAIDLRTLKKIKRITAIHLHPITFDAINYQCSEYFITKVYETNYLVYNDELYEIKINNLCSDIFIEVEE